MSTKIFRKNNSRNYKHDLRVRIRFYVFYFLIIIIFRCIIELLFAFFSLPGFHLGTKRLRTAFGDVQRVMGLVQSLKGSVKNQSKTVSPIEETIVPARKLKIKLEFYKLRGVVPINLVYKPVFTKQFYRFRSAKSRFTAELLQAAAILFIDATEKAFWSGE